MKALVADDEGVVQKLLVDCLYNLGFDYVDSVTSGRAVYSLGSLKYDLMLVDIMMPDWTGLEGLELARAFGNHSPVIIMTGMPNLVEDCKLPLLIKPFTIEDLQFAIEKILRIDLKSNFKIEKNKLIGGANI